MHRDNRAIFGLSCILLLLLVNCSTSYCSNFQEFVIDGDRAYALRKADNLLDIDRAISSYQQALELDQQNLPIHFKLIEALYFKGYHVTVNSFDKEEIFSRVLELSEESLDLISDLAKANLRDLSPEKQAEKVKDIAFANETYFWSSISWGLWGMTFGNFASARKAVATKVRDYATVLMLIDPNYASGGGSRLLGRLHTLAPKIPFFTYWIDREYGIELLRKANTVSVEDPRNQLFLAEALLKYQPDNKSEALRLLKEVSVRTPRNDYYVEQLESISLAKKHLMRLESND